MLLGESSVRESFQNKALEKRPVQVKPLLTFDLERIAIDFRSQLPKFITQNNAVEVAIYTYL